MSGEAKIGLAAVILMAVAVTVTFGRMGLGAKADDPPVRLAVGDEAEISALVAALPDGSGCTGRGNTGAPGGSAISGPGPAGACPSPEGVRGISGGEATAASGRQEVPPSHPGLTVPPDPPASADSGMFYSYTLQEGDSFWTVSSKVYGSVRYCDRIAEANPGLRSTSLRPGRTIRVPAIPGVRMLTDLPPAGTFAGSAGTFVEARSVEVPQAGNRRPDAAGVVPGGASAMPRPGQAATSPPAGPPLPAAPAGVRARDAAARSAPGSDPATTPAGIPTAVAGLGATGANPPAGTPASDSGKTHTVAKGDTLAGLSRKYYGDEKHWKRIADANPDADPARLKTGAVLKIPPASR